MVLPGESPGIGLDDIVGATVVIVAVGLGLISIG